MVSALALAAAVAVTVGAGARGAEVNRCSLGGRFPVTSVARYTTVENAGYTTYEQFRGAEVIVPAQPGLTREWLQRVLSYQVAAGECDFGSTDAKVSVMPAGGAFSVRISANDDRAAGEILRHAQQLVK